MTCTDQQAIMVLENHGNGISTFKAAYGRESSLAGSHALLDIIVEQMGDGLGIRFRDKATSLCLQFGFERRKAFDNAVLDDRNLACRMWVGIGFGWRAVCGPTALPDAV